VFLGGLTKILQALLQLKTDEEEERGKTAVHVIDMNGNPLNHLAQQCDHTDI